MEKYAFERGTSLETALENKGRVEKRLENRRHIKENRGGLVFESTRIFNICLLVFDAIVSNLNSLMSINIVVLTGKEKD